MVLVACARVSTCVSTVLVRVRMHTRTRSRDHAARSVQWPAQWFAAVQSSHAFNLLLSHARRRSRRRHASPSRPRAQRAVCGMTLLLTQAVRGELVRHAHARDEEGGGSSRHQLQGDRECCEPNNVNRIRVAVAGCLARWILRRSPPAAGSPARHKHHHTNAFAARADREVVGATPN